MLTHWSYVFLALTHRYDFISATALMLPISPMLFASWQPHIGFNNAFWHSINDRPWQLVWNFNKEMADMTKQLPIWKQGLWYESTISNPHGWATQYIAIYFPYSNCSSTVVVILFPKEYNNTNIVCMINITNSRVIIDINCNVILLVATREAMGLSGWQPLDDMIGYRVDMVCYGLFSCGYIMSSTRLMWSIYPYSSGLIHWLWSNFIIKK